MSSVCPLLQLERPPRPTHHAFYCGHQRQCKMSDTDYNEAEWDMAEEEIIDDDESDAQYARTLQLFENARTAAQDNPDIIPFDKGYELCCFVCRCGDCDEVSGDDERVSAYRFGRCINKTVSSPTPLDFRCLGSIPNNTQKIEVLPSGKSWNVRLHRKCCSTIKKIDVDDSEYVVTSYGLALTNPSLKKRRLEPARVTFSDLRQAKDRADQLRVTVLGDQSYHGK